MRGPLSKICAFFKVIEGRPYDAYQVLFATFFVGLWRLAMETMFGSEHFGFEGVVHFPVFYLHWFFYFTTVGAILTRQDWRRTANIVLYGILFGMLPPLIDTLAYGPGNYQYSPKFFDRFGLLLWIEGFPVGESIALWLAVAGVGFYVFVRTASPLRTLAAVVFGYLEFLAIIYVLFPGTEALRDLLGGASPEMTRFGVLTIVLLMVTYFNFLIINGKRFYKSLLRFNHALPWVAVVFLGARLMDSVTPFTWLLALVVLVIHQSAIFANDYYDRDADHLEGRGGGIDSDDVAIFHAVSVWLALAVLLISPIPGVLLLLYVTATAAYHHRAVRLKNICPINYKTEGLVGAFALAIGMTSVASSTLGLSALLALFLTFGGFSLVSMLKDYKDLKSDSVFSVRTIYLVLGDRGWPLSRIHRLVTGIVTACLAVPVIWLMLLGASPIILSLLVLAFLLPIPLSLLYAPPKRAVEASVWLVSGYLFVLAWLVPSGMVTVVR